MLVLAVVTVLAFLPGSYKGRLATFGFVHAATHIAAFSLVYILIAAGSRSLRECATLLLILLVFGTALEFVQSRVYGTALEFGDITMNAAGVVLGFFIGFVGRTGSRE